jgi:hypothetical protein
MGLNCEIEELKEITGYFYLIEFEPKFDIHF